MNPKSDNSPPTTCSESTCASGFCGSSGLCPGVALFIAYALGAGLSVITGLHWLGWAVGVPLFLILLTGAWIFLPHEVVSSESEIDDHVDLFAHHGHSKLSPNFSLVAATAKRMTA